jgi:hypothetical protein
MYRERCSVDGMSCVMKRPEVIAGTKIESRLRPVIPHFEEIELKRYRSSAPELQRAENGGQYRRRRKMKTKVLLMMACMLFASGLLRGRLLQKLAR